MNDSAKDACLFLGRLAMYMESMNGKKLRLISRNPLSFLRMGETRNDCAASLVETVRLRMNISEKEGNML